MDQVERKAVGYATGYEYVVVGYCKCGRPFLRPYWSHKQHDPPIYTSCLCGRAQGR